MATSAVQPVFPHDGGLGAVAPADVEDPSHSASNNDIELSDAPLPPVSNARAPTALLSAQDFPAGPVLDTSADDEVMLDSADLSGPAPPHPSQQATPLPKALQTRRIPIPPNRLSPIRAAWPQIYPPLCEQLMLQVRVRNRAVELRASRLTRNPEEAIQKGEDFMRAIVMGFELADAVALLRLDDMFIETFEIKDIRTLQGDALARAIGRIAGTGGKMKHAIENATTTRIVLAGQKIHILGRFKEIRMARETVVTLVLGSRPGKVHQQLRTIATRRKERF